MSSWRDAGACAGDDQARYFDPVEPGQPHDEAGLAFARSRCFECPVRFECLDAAMGWEEGSAESYRFGIWGGLTPQQRASLWRRGPDSWRCAGCGLTYDPTALMRGLQVCGCDTKIAAPISDRGDEWAERHTTLAKRVIAWVVASFEPGDEVPTPTAWARDNGVRKDDASRVWRALAEDGVITQTGRGRYERVAGAGALRRRGRARTSRG